jgi:sugar/nucleoside kinase (ribokinase family)
VAAAGLVGKDVLGAAVMQRLEAMDVSTTAVFTTEDAQTSATVVAVEPGGERCFFHTPGATTLLDADLFRRCMPVFRQSAFVHIGYFGLLPALTPDLAKVICDLRQAAPDVKVSLDTVNPPGKWEQLVPVLPHLDIFAPSRTEAEALTGEKTPTKMVAALRKHMRGGLVGIKLDAEGCYLDDGKQAVTVPPAKITVVDTTGAGDTWFGGLLMALHRNMPLEQAGRFANRVAADCCTAIGASAGIRSFEDTAARM